MEKESIVVFKNTFLESILEDANSFFAKLYQTKGFENAIIQKRWHKFLAKELLSEKDNSIESFKAKHRKPKS